MLCVLSMLYAKEKYVSSCNALALLTFQFLQSSRVVVLPYPMRRVQFPPSEVSPQQKYSA